MDRRSMIRNMASAATVGFLAPFAVRAIAQTLNNPIPDIIANPVEVTGSAAVPRLGSLPGKNQMYYLPDRSGDLYRIGSFMMAHASRPIDNGGLYDLMTFEGPAGSHMPAHVRLDSHACLIVMSGELDIQLGSQVWRALRGDFVNVPPGSVLSWKVQSTNGRLVLYASGFRAGLAFMAMGSKVSSYQLPTSAQAISAEGIAKASIVGDFQPRFYQAVNSAAVRINNTTLPAGAQPYVLLDGGGDRYGGAVFYARGRNTNGQFLIVMSEGTAGGLGAAVGAHFHARHTEDFFALDGEMYGWANGEAVLMQSGSFFHTPPRHLHGYKLMSPYTRFVGILTTAIFEEFFPALINGTPPSTIVGPDGYPLDVHAHQLPLPPQSPVWDDVPPVTVANATDKNLQYLMHAQVCSDRPGEQFPMPKELRRALQYKRRAEDFA